MSKQDKPKSMVCGAPWDKTMYQRGYIIRHVGLVQPVVELCTTKENNDLYGIPGSHALFILAMDIRYKFQCEDFEDKFERTAEFIKASIQKSHQYRTFFKTKERKLLDSNPRGFFNAFKVALKEDLDTYYGKYGKELATKMKKEINKIDYEQN